MYVEASSGIAPFWCSFTANGYDNYNDIAKFEWDFEGSIID
jgi:hypothetical protein